MSSVHPARGVVARLEAQLQSTAYKTLSTAHRRAARLDTDNLSSDAVDDDWNSHTVVALVDNKAGEVGIATCNVTRASIALTQHGDNATHARTLMYLTVVRPDAILIPHTIAEGALALALSSSFADEASLIAVHRRDFNDTKGARALANLAANLVAKGDHAFVSSLDVAHESADRYLSLSAAHALLVYLDATSHVAFAPHTVRVVFQSLEGFVQMDRASARGLRVLGPLRSAATHNHCHALLHNGHSGGGAHTPSLGSSLVEVLDNCALTAGGRRMLRENVLQPLRDVKAIALRQRAVAFLLRHRECAAVLRSQLVRLRGRDPARLVTALSTCVPRGSAAVSVGAVHSHHRQTQAVADVLVDSVVALHSVFRTVQSIQAILERFLPPAGRSAATEEACTHRKRHRDGLQEDDNADELSGETDAALLEKVLQTLSSCNVEELFLSVIHANVSEDVLSSASASVGSFPAPAPATVDGEAAPLEGNSERSRVAPDARRSNLGGVTTTCVRQQRCRVSAMAMQAQRCFAVKPAVNSTLDVARCAYAERLESLFAHVDELRQTHALASLRLSYDKQRDYYLTLDATECTSSRAPDDVFLRKCVAKRSRTASCTTVQVLMLRASIQDALAEVAQAQLAVLHEHIVVHVRRHMGILHAMCDALSLLDLVVAFSTFGDITGAAVAVPVSLERDEGLCLPGLFPLVTDNSGIDKSKAPFSSQRRHPTSVIVDKEAPVVVLSGPNASGKSTLLRTIAHAVILAHIGCPVPCSAVSHSFSSNLPRTRLVDRIVALLPPEERRCSGGSYTALTESSFCRDMRRLAFATGVVTSDTLVLIDELGRGTTTHEAAAIGSAVIEWLADTKCLALFATHVTALTRLPDICSTVRNRHMMARLATVAAAPSYGTAVRDAHEARNRDQWTRAPTAAAKVRLQFQFELADGAFQSVPYGLLLAEQLSVHPALLAHVPEFLNILSTSDNGTKKTDDGDKRNTDLPHPSNAVATDGGSFNGQAHSCTGTTTTTSSESGAGASTSLRATPLSAFADKRRRWCLSSSTAVAVDWSSQWNGGDDNSAAASSLPPTTSSQA